MTGRWDWGGAGPSTSFPFLDAAGAVELLPAACLDPFLRVSTLIHLSFTLVFCIVYGYDFNDCLHTTVVVFLTHS